MRIQRVKFFVCVVLILSFCLIERSHALEADQYLIWKNLSLKDSTEVANTTINSLLDEFLTNEINNRYHSLSCGDVAAKFMMYVRPNFFMNRFKRDLIENQEVYLYPAEKNIFQNYNSSIYHGLYWPFIMPVAQTIRLNNVFTGTDKIDHFFSSGRLYYHVYRKWLKKGLSSDEAAMKAIEFGTGQLQETGILGYWSSAAFSYADMESNYQGMRMGIDLCEGKAPLLEKNEGDGWVRKGKIDFKNYVNPQWDEAFNNSYFLSYRKHGAEKAILEEYCDLAKRPEVQRLWKGYHARFKPSLDSDYLRGLMLVGRVPDPRPQSLHNLCGFKDGVMEGTSAWEMKN